MKTYSAQNACTSIINGATEMIFTCLSNITITELPLYDYTTNELEQITSIVVNGPNENTRGPFTSIPPNICFLPNLQVCLKYFNFIYVCICFFFEED